MARGFEVLVLAGGLGTRLREAVPDVPKPMAPVGGVPFLARLLDLWRRRGAGRFVLSVGYRADMIRGYFGDSRDGAAIAYVREETPLGTGGALALALAGGAVTADEFFLINGDTWLDPDPEAMRAVARRLDVPAVMAVAAAPDGGRYGRVEADAAGLATGFADEASSSRLVNAGCYLLEAARLAAEVAGFPAAFSLERRLLPALAAAGTLGVHLCADGFVDIGVPEDYARLARLFENGEGEKR